MKTLSKTLSGLLLASTALIAPGLAYAQTPPQDPVPAESQDPEGQEPEEIHLEAYASMGKGREHARFNPVAQCAYSYTRDDDAGRIKEMWQRWLIEQKKVDPKELEKDADRKGMLERRPKRRPCRRPERSR
jgi:DNA-directed RNA polymerase alpha subunit